MQNDVSPALAALISVQDGQGGWGWRRGAPANTECTALSVLALHAWSVRDDARSAALRRGIAWLESKQRDDGSWPLSDQVPDASWMTSVAAYALATVQPGSEHAARGGTWLLGQKNRKPTFLQRIRMALTDEPPAVDQDPSIEGWPWTSETTAWVEPTSWALLALKRMRGALPRSRTDDRIAEAHRMLADRMCRGGGWNYGNKAVMGYDLEPYPDTTALGLIALQDSPAKDVTEPGISALGEMLEANRSALVLALSVLALQLHARDVAAERNELANRLPQLASDADVRVLALAILALDERQPRRRLADHA